MKISHNKKTKKILAHLDKKQIGYLKYSFPRDASTLNSKPRNIIIDYVYVNKKFRRSGIASKLISEIIQIAKKQGLVWITLWTGRQSELEESFRLYEKAGFKQKAIQGDYYDKNIATRLFAKRLDNDYN